MPNGSGSTADYAFSAAADAKRAIEKLEADHARRLGDLEARLREVEARLANAALEHIEGRLVRAEGILREMGLIG